MSTSSPESEPVYSPAQVQEISDRLESLGHSLAFEKILDENMTSSSSKLALKTAWLPKEALPTGFDEAHQFARDFRLTDIRANLDYCPAQVDEVPATWNMSASYKIGDIDFVMQSDAEKTTVSSRTFDDVELEYKLRPGSSREFLAILAMSIAQKNPKIVLPPGAKVPDTETTDPEVINSLMYQVGNQVGAYGRITSAFFPGIDRSVVVRQVEAESPSESGIIIDYGMIWHIAGTLSTAVKSHQQELIGHMKDDIDLLWESKFNERLPEFDVDPNDPHFIIADEIRHRAVPADLCFAPDADNDLAYAAINASILQVLEPYLEQYAHLDTVGMVDEEIPEEEAFKDVSP